MRFLHISDLHIGKRVNGFSMLEDQEYILNQILSIIDKEDAQGVWIAGDIYDKPIPSAEAVSLFDDFLTKLAKRELPIFIISGNHDSPERLAFGAKLLDDRRIYISPVFTGKIEPVILKDFYGELAVYLMPFVKPAIVRHAYPDAEIETYQDAVRTVIAHMQVDTDRRNVLVAHQFVTGAVRCESEEISVGGIDNVDAALFDAFDYAALGHIHKAQHIGRETVRYCGAPLKYSVSEAEDDKSALLVDMQEKGSVAFRFLPLVPKYDVRKLKGTYMELTAKTFYDQFPTKDYMHITLTDEEDIPEVIGKLSVIYPRIMQLSYDNARTRNGQEPGAAPQIEEKTPMQLIREFYEKQNHRQMQEEQLSYVEDLLERLQGI